MERDRAGHESNMVVCTQLSTKIFRTTREIALVLFLTTCFNFMSVPFNAKTYFKPCLERLGLMHSTWALPATILAELNEYRNSRNRQSFRQPSSYNQSDPIDFFIACGNALRHCGHGRVLMEIT
eukprot:GILK01014003.1.p1 GENE.GILK01014003.1~~GILK01014003.1.p1  ORF type:complete len:124 (+),score=0.66 GILK01014003.1:709-1080(+)